MKKITLFTLSFLISLCAFGQIYLKKGPENLRDPNLATEVAKKENKIVMYLFTDFERDSICKRLYDSVLSTSKFEEFAKENIAFVNIDSTKRNGYVDKEYADEYNTIKQNYTYTGLPAMILINPKNGNTSISIGYTGISVNNFIKNIENFKRRR